MGDLITFSESPLTVTSDVSTWLAAEPPWVEVGRYDEMDLQLYVVGLKGDGLVFELAIETSMFGGQHDANWVRLGAFTAVTGVPSAERVTFKNLLRYVRWRVITFNQADLVAFLLSGIVRAHQ